MDIQCQACKTIFRVKDGFIPAETKIRFTCKKCRPVIGSVDGSAFSKLATTAAISHPALDQSEEKRHRLMKERVLNSIRDLPAMPPVIIEIQNQMTTADMNTRKICGLIETDQAVTTKVLRAANSAFFGQSGTVSTIQGALNLIGLKGLMEVVSLIGAHRLLVGKLPGYGYDAKDLWTHSLAVAYGSKLLALERDPAISDTAHLSGLIHDVGRIILDRFIVEKKAEIAAFMENEQKTFLDAETKFFGMNHAKVAAEVCRKWKFPAVMAHAIGWHHEPSGSGKDLLAHILHMADHLATMIGIGYDSDDVLSQVEEGTMDFLGLKQVDLGELVSRTMESVNQATQI